MKHGVEVTRLDGHCHWPDRRVTWHDMAGDGRGSTPQITASTLTPQITASTSTPQIMASRSEPIRPELPRAPGPSPPSSRPLLGLRCRTIPAVLAPRHRRRRVPSPPFSRPRPSRPSSRPWDSHPPPASSSLGAGSDLAAAFYTSICSGAPRRRSWRPAVAGLRPPLPCIRLQQRPRTM